MLMLLLPLRPMKMCCARLHCCFGFGLLLKWRTRRRKKILERLLGYLFCIQTRCNYSWLLIFRQQWQQLAAVLPFPPWSHSSCWLRTGEERMNVKTLRYIFFYSFL